ncbi:MAG: EAL domain-containing protein [Pseudomonadota bacterium]
MAEPPSLNDLNTWGQEIDALAAKLRSDGWDRLRGVRMIHAASRVWEACQATGWIEASGRAEELTAMLQHFVRDPPPPRRLDALLHSAELLARLLTRACLSADIDPDYLPVRPHDWIFLLVGKGLEISAPLFQSLCTLGFRVDCLVDDLKTLAPFEPGQVILVAHASWLSEHPEGIQRLRDSPLLSASCLVAIEDTQDFLSRIRARQAGARVLFESHQEASHLIDALSGVAWMPSTPYRVMMLDDNSGVLHFHASLLQEKGFEVMALEDPVAALEFMDVFDPEVLVLDVVMPACRGTDLAALCRRDKRFAHLPVIYLSAYTELANQLDAREAGSEDYLVKPVEGLLLVSAVQTRARWRRQFERTYRQQRQAWRQLEQLRAALDAHALVSITTTDGTIVHANEKFCEITGYRQEELIGRNHRISNSGHHPPEFFSNLWRTISSGRIWQGEIQNRCRDGSLYWTQATLFPLLDERGHPERFVAIRTDISRQKQMQEEQDRHARLMALACQCLQHYITTANLHDTAVRLLDGLLPLADSPHGCLAEVLHDPDGTLHIKTQAGTGTPPGYFDRIFETVIQSGQITITTITSEPHGDPPPSDALGIPVYYGETLVSLMGLAGRPGGYDPALVTFLAPLTAAYASLLESARLRRFQQMVIDELAQTHTVSRTIGKEGLPLMPAESGREEAVSRHHLLVVEDNPANQAVLRMQLEALGFTVDVANNGQEALSQWPLNRYDLLLVDRHMPVLDGLALTRAIRAAERAEGGHIPIIAITADRLEEAEASCRDAGMDDILSKPIEMTALQDIIRRWLPAKDLHKTLVSAPPTETSAHAIRVLDMTVLTRITGDIHPKAMRQLIDLFITAAQSDLALCRLHLHYRDGEALAESMHKLKSSSATVGAQRFSQLATSLEELGQKGEMIKAMPLFDELVGCLADVEASAARLILPEGFPAAIVDPLPDSGKPCHILIIDDDAVIRHQLRLLLSSQGISEVLSVADGRSALLELERPDNQIDMLFCDLHMPEMDGIELLRRLAASGFSGGVILISGVEARLLQTTAELVRLQGLNLVGTLQKPVTREALSLLLKSACLKSVVPNPPHRQITVTPEDILDGLKNNEFEIYFQPKVDAATLRPVGVEALARWQRATGEQIPPDIFIKVAEQHGLIGALSEMLLTKAFVGSARLSQAGYPLGLAVNLSAAWLFDVRLPEFIQTHLHKTGLRIKDIVLEITETGVMADLTSALDVMTRLRLKGFKLSIDDFGTGYSSIDQLQRIPFDELKLDRSFVQRAAQSTSSRTILASSLEMARKLGLTTVAEGVETQADLDLVRGLGCHLVQGWLIAKAMPVEDLILWLKTQPAH